jgi:hypothetical protein
MTEEEIKDEIRRIVKEQIAIAFDENKDIVEEEKTLIINSDLLDGIIEDVVDDYWESSLKNWEGEVTKEVIAKVIDDDKIDNSDVGGPLDIF